MLNLCGQIIRAFIAVCWAWISYGLAQFTPLGACQAQLTGVARGRVIAVVDSAPVMGALIKIGTDSTRTSSSGAFELRNIPLGRHTLQVNALGFSPLRQAIVVDETGWDGRIVLARLQLLQPVSVRALALRPTEFANTAKYDDFFRRRHLGHGTFRTREDVLKLGAPDLASALQSIAGFTVTSTFDPNGQLEYRFRIPRCPGQPPNLAIYIDGVRVTHSGTRSQNRGSELSGLFRPRRVESSCDECARIADVLSSVNITSIEFLEVYRGVGELPSDVDRDDACAAVMIWTR